MYKKLSDIIETKLRQSILELLTNESLDRINQEVFNGEFTKGRIVEEIDIILNEDENMLGNLIPIEVIDEIGE